MYLANKQELKCTAHFRHSPIFFALHFIIKPQIRETIPYLVFSEAYLVLVSALGCVTPSGAEDSRKEGGGRPLA